MTIPWALYLFASAVSLVVSYVVGIFLIKRTPKRINRGVRSMPPRLGGTIIFIALSVSAILALLVFGIQFHGSFRKLTALIVAGILIFLLGNLDDQRKLHYSVKIISEIIILSLLPLSGFDLNFMTNLGGDLLKVPDWLGQLAIIGWLLFMMNAVNLIDGLDGLASGIVAIAAFTIFLLSFMGNYVIATAALALSASLVGILPFNRYPAKIYLGDSGSLLIGFLIGFLSLFFHVKTYSAIVVLVPLFILFVPIFNTISVMFDRIRKGRNPFEGDIFHIHYRLLRQGLSHQATVVFLWLVTASLCALIVLRQYFPFRPRTVVFLISVLAMYMGFFQVFLVYLKLKRQKQNAARVI